MVTHLLAKEESAGSIPVTYSQGVEQINLQPNANPMDVKARSVTIGIPSSSVSDQQANHRFSVPSVRGGIVRKAGQL